MRDISFTKFIEETYNGKKWILIFGKIYDIQHFINIHPGGAKIMSSYIGKDASDAWMAMHPDKTRVIKFLKSLKVGNLTDYATTCGKENIDMIENFRNLRQFAEKKLLFDSKFSFFMIQYLQILFFEMCAWLCLYLCGLTTCSFLIAALLISTAQAQAGWAQHDYGHLSVFNTRKLNKMMHQLIIGHLKGASSSWWNYRHNLHHSKPNIIKTDPDIDFPYLFILGSKMPIEWAQKRRGFMPYHHQHKYFFLFGPPILLPLYFHFENMYFIMKRWKIRDLALTISFFVKFFFFYGPFFDSWVSIFGLYMTARFFESFWFTMVTQMSHIPMEIDRDNDLNWVAQQLRSTRNVQSSKFNDWFTGHLNFQIEHHLFPDMPRHNFHLIKPEVYKFCKRFDLAYVEKPLLQAFIDIIKSLEQSGNLWIEVYRNPG